MHPARSGKSLNRSVAEIAFDFGKPGGVTVVSQEKLVEFLGLLPVERILLFNFRIQQENRKL